MATLTNTALQSNPNVKLIASGKVREIYELTREPHHLLFVTTDRISAFDVILASGIKHRGAILTLMSKFWFEFLHAQLPDVKTHYVSAGLPKSLKSSLPDQDARELSCRCMVVKRLDVLPIESICRGYISGSAWSSYKNDCTVNGIKLEPGLQESDRLPEILWTPSTKASGPGEHDENISRQRAAEIIGEEYAAQVEYLSRRVYSAASNYAAERGILIADTKFEFALDRSVEPPAVVLCDEVLTPDSSRFWAASEYEPGRLQASLDKQGLREWLAESGLKGKDGVEIPREISSRTESAYRQAYHALTGQSFEDDMELVLSSNG